MDGKSRKGSKGKSQISEGTWDTWEKWWKFESDCSEDKCRWIAIYSYEADNRDGRENIGGWRKDFRTKKPEKYSMISKHKAHYLILKRTGGGKWTQELKVRVTILRVRI